MSSKRVITFIFIAFLFIVTLVLYVNNAINQQLIINKIKLVKPIASKPIPVAKTKKQTGKKRKKIRHELIPADPADYEMTVHTEATIPRSAEQWELHIKNVLSKQKI